MAPREGDKPAAEMLRQSLAPPSQVEGSCPDAEILASYFERSLDAEETARWELHFSECAICRDQLAALARAGEFVPAGQGARERDSSWSWLWDWRLMVPAFAVLMIAVGLWYAGHRDQPRMVAMSTPSGLSPAPSAESLQAPSMLAPTAPPAPAPAPANEAAETNAARQMELSRDQMQSLKKSENALDSTSAANQQLAAPYSVSSAPAPKDEARPEPAAPSRVQNSADTMSATTQSAELTPPAPPAPAIAGGAAPPTAPSPRNGMSGGTLSGVAGFGAARAMSRNKVMPATPAAAASPRAQDKTAAAAQEVAKSSSQAVIHTPDPKIMWRIAEAGFVEHTTDGGATWEGQMPGPDTQLADGSAPSAKVCWLVGSGGVVLLTTDGNNWKTVPPPATADLVAVTAQNASSATVSAADGRKFSTIDAGKHWNPAQ